MLEDLLSDAASSLGEGVVESAIDKVSQRSGCGSVLEKATKGCLTVVLVVWLGGWGLLGLWALGKAVIAWLH